MDASKIGGCKTRRSSGEQLTIAETVIPVTTSIYTKSHTAQEVPDQNMGRAGKV